MDRNSLKLLLAQGFSVEKIARRFGKDPSTVSYWMDKHGLVTPNREKHAAKGGIERGRLEELAEAGASIADMAAAVGLSKTTVRYWLRKHGILTSAARRAAAGSQARAGGMLTVSRTCQRHGEVDFVIEGRGYYRCKLCRQEQVARRRRTVKQILVAEAGGRCVICGYDRYLGALQFHHLNPEQKQLEISRHGATLALAIVQAEARKCVLVCSNCHAELEGGMVALPDTVQPGEG